MGFVEPRHTDLQSSKHILRAAPLTLRALAKRVLLQQF
jgi:hypothetical protein